MRKILLLLLLAAGGCQSRLDTRGLHSAHLGEEYLRAGRLQEAREALTHSIELNPGYAPSYNNLGLIAAQQGSMREAKRLFELAAGP